MEWYSFIGPSIAAYKLSVRAYAYSKRLYHYATTPTVLFSRDRPRDALVQMRLVLRYAEECNEDMADTRIHVFENSNEFYLKPGGKALQRARILDPSAVLEVEHKEHGTLRYTQDDLAGFLLFNEAQAFHKDAFDFPNMSYSPIGRMMHRYKKRSHEHKYLGKAKTAIERAIKFEPFNSLYKRRYVHILCDLGEKRKARVVIQEALKMFPENLDLHQLKDELGL